MTFDLSNADPRLSHISEPPMTLDDLELVVGRPPRRGGSFVISSGFILAAALLFLALNSNRTHAQAASLVAPADQTVGLAPPVQSPPPALELRPPTPPTAPLAQPPSPAPVAPTVATPSPTIAPAMTNTAERTPTMVVDLGQPPGAPVEAAPDPAAGAGPSAPAPSGGAGFEPGGGGGPQFAAADPAPQPSLDDQFAARLGDETPPRSRAVTMTNLDALVPQGAIISATLETAINSDVPGYTRAVVSRDVLSFDGKKVLIPRGSRLIGQYKSGVSLGSTRAFIIWTRIIRDDGVSIQIGSPGTDPLGRTGLSGQVDTHFFDRFGGSILLSVLNAGVAAVSQHPSTTVSIGSSGAAVGAATSVQGDAIPSTITVAQGAAVNIFVARDLDFSQVADVK